MPPTTEQDLLALIAAGAQESLTLEYKRCAALENTDPRKNAISKDVSAFANSAGGTLIYGVTEEDHVPIGLDDGFDPVVTTREWLEQVIVSRIQPKIPNVQIIPVTLSGAKAGRTAYVVEVPQSHTAHQAFDKKYYKRRNFLAEPMEDYEIRDVFNRAKTPLMVPQFNFSRIERGAGETHFNLDIHLHNQGDVSAHHIRFEIGLPSRLILSGSAYHFGQGQRINQRDGRNYEERVFIALSSNQMIFPDQAMSLSNWGYGGLAIVMSRDNYILMRRTRAEVTWLVYADDMRRQEGALPLLDLINY